MKTNRQSDPQGHTKFTETSAYFPILFYILLSLCIRIAALSPLAVLVAEPEGWSIQWISLLSPIVMIAVVMPMRFSFARALMTAAEGKPFSPRQSLRFTRYRKKLLASLWHVLRLLCWGLPLLLTLGWMYYLMDCADAFQAIRILSAMGGALSAVMHFFGNIGYEGGFMEGLYVLLGIAGTALLVLVWGIWRCSVYRYLWAVRTQKGARVRIRKQLRGYRWKQLCSGLYNLALWAPTLLFAFLIVMSIQTKFSDVLTTFLDTHTLPPIALPQGVWILAVIGLLFHLAILPIRRSVTAKFVNSVVTEKDNVKSA